MNIGTPLTCLCRCFDLGLGLCWAGHSGCYSFISKGLAPGMNGEKGTLLTLLCRNFRAHCGRCSLTSRRLLSCRRNLVRVEFSSC